MLTSTTHPTTQFYAISVKFRFICVTSKDLQRHDDCSWLKTQQ